MEKQYKISCECGTVSVLLKGSPKVRGHCHCEDCRSLLNVPFHSVTAWDKEQLEFVSGKDAIVEYQHPSLEMKRGYCMHCGETIYNTNAMDWRVVSQYLIIKCNDGSLPEELRAKNHFYYKSRLFDIDDDLPKI